MRRALAPLAALVLLAACQGPPLPAAADADRAAGDTYRLAEAGDPAAQTVLGNLFEQGVYGPPDGASAAWWYERAVDQGDSLAAFCLAGLYEHGNGVPLDLAAAAVLYRRAAEGGVASAAFKLGFLYEKGLGVPRDFARARHWYDVAQRGWIALGVRAPQPAYLAADATPEEVANLLQPVELPPPVPAAPASATTPPLTSQTPAEVAHDFQVHLGSERSIAAALADWRALRARFPRLLAGLRPALATLDLGSGSIFYQLLAGPLANETTADALCARLQPQGQYCNPIVPRG